MHRFHKLFPRQFLDLLAFLSKGGGVVFGLFLLPMVSFATETTQPAELMASTPDPSQYFGKIMMSLIFILLIIFVSAWMLKRFGSFTGLNNVNMKVIGAINVGQKERIVLLEVGKEQLVIGVTPAEISMLHKLEEPVETESQKTLPVAGSFASRLQEAMAQRLNKQSVAKPETPAAKKGETSV